MAKKRSHVRRSPRAPRAPREAPVSRDDFAVLESRVDRVFQQLSARITTLEHKLLPLDQMPSVDPDA